MMEPAILGTELIENLETAEKQEEHRLESIISDNPLDFDTWLDLVKHIESYVMFTQKIPEKNIQAYERILKEYPLCYGFWRKLADIHSVQRQEEKVISTYEKALEYLPVGPEIWVAYCSWACNNKTEDFTRK